METNFLFFLDIPKCFIVYKFNAKLCLPRRQAKFPRAGV